MANYYEILEIERTSTEKEIKSAYRKLAKKWHPDTTKLDKKYAAEKFKEVTNAYNVLSDAEARKKYDYNLNYEARLREESRRREQARQEAERRRQEQARQEAERRRQEQARQEAERRRQEQARQEAERRYQEQARQEAERRYQEQARQEAERRYQEQARQETGYSYYVKRKKKLREKILNGIMHALFGYKRVWYNFILAYIIPWMLVFITIEFFDAKYEELEILIYNKFFHQYYLLSSPGDPSLWIQITRRLIHIFRRIIPAVLVPFFLMYPCYFLSYIRNDYKRNKEIFWVFLASSSFAVFLHAFDQLIDLIFAILYLFKYINLYLLT